MARYNSDTKETFIQKAKLFHEEKYDYSNIVYQNSKIPIEIICNKHGSFFQLSSNHLRSGCEKCAIDNRKTTLSNFIEKCKLIHNNFYDYSNTIYVNSKTDIEIICPNHGKFFQVSKTHMDGHGCPICGNDRNIKRMSGTCEKFIEKSKFTHGDIHYNYDNINYINSRTAVNIKCNIHKIEFNQIPYNHINGANCPLCSKEIISEKNKDNLSGWTYTIWHQRGITSKHFDSFKLYILYCHNDSEEFYKIGKTYRKIKDRFKSSMEMPYNYKIVEVFESDAHTISEYENILKSLHKKFIHKPLIPFHGKYECFKIIDNIPKNLLKYKII